MDLSIPLPPEVEKGNIEYKLHLKLCDYYKFEKLSAQMLWRLNEGKHVTCIPEATYYVGVMDNGSIGNETIQSVNESISVLEKVSNLCNAEIVSIDIKKITDYYIGIIKIKKYTTVVFKKDSRLIVLGDNFHGKSTLISVLTYSELDNGYGSARHNVLQYSHEIGSGETSSIKYEILGFNKNQIVNYSQKNINSWEDILLNSDKIISFIDLPGKQKFFKTTYFGLMTTMATNAIIVIDISCLHSCKDNIDKYNYLCTELNIPHFIVLTKIDLLKKNIVNDIVLTLKERYKNINIIPVSHVTGENINTVLSIIKNLQSEKKQKVIIKKGKQFMINNVSCVQDVGIVLSGIVLSGTIKVGDKLLLGPFGQQFHSVKIKSIHIKQLPSKILNEYDSGTVVIKVDSSLEHKKITKHMMLITIDKIQEFSSTFYIKVSLKKNMSFKKDIYMTMFSMNVIEQIKIISIQRKDNFLLVSAELRTKDIIRFIPNNRKIILKQNKNITVGTIYSTNILCSDIKKVDTGHV